MGLVEAEVVKTASEAAQLEEGGREAAEGGEEVAGRLRAVELLEAVDEAELGGADLRLVDDARD